MAKGSDYIALKAFYAFGKWWTKGDIIKNDCYNCMLELIKQGKIKKNEQSDSKNNNPNR